MLSFPLSGGRPSSTSLGTHPGYVASRWYSLINSNTTNAVVAATNTLYFFPFTIQSPVTIASMRMRVVTGGTTSAVKAGIWANSPISARPLGTPLYSDNTGVATTSSSTNITLAIAGVLNPGIYWFGSKHTGTLPTMQAIGASGAPPVEMARLVGVEAASGTFPSLAFGWSIADTYSNDIAATSIAEGASFTVVASPAVPNAAIVT